MHKKLQIFSIKFIGITMAITMMFLFLSCLINTTYLNNFEWVELLKNNHFISDLFFISFFIGIMFFIDSLSWNKRWNKILLILLFIYTVLISSFMIFSVNPVPQWDQFYIIDGTIGFINGNFNYLLKGGYLNQHPHQLGLSAYYEILLRLTDVRLSYSIVQLFNVLLICLIFLGFYFIVKELTHTHHSKSLKLMLFLSFGMLPLIMYSAYCYGIIPGLFFAVWGGLYCVKFCKEETLKNGILTIFFSSLAPVIKSNYYVFSIAVFIVLLIKTVSIRKCRYLIIGLISLMLSISLNKGLIMFNELRSGLKIENSMPMSPYITMGMQESSRANGWFNSYNWLLHMETDYDTELTDKLARKQMKIEIQEFIDNPEYALEFYHDKIVSIWCEPTFGSFWVNKNPIEEDSHQEQNLFVNDFFNGKLNECLRFFMKIYQYILYLGTFLYAIFHIKEKDIFKMVLLIYIFGGFLFHILWEAKSSYVLCYYSCMLPLAAIGFENLFISIRKRIKPVCFTRQSNSK